MKPNMSTLHVIILIVSILPLLREISPSNLPKNRGCPHQKCGNLSISYPFGIGKNCYLNEQFEVFCNATSHVMKHVMFGGEVYKIEEGHLGMMFHFYPELYNETSDQQKKYLRSYGYASGSYSFSGAKNKLIAFGCDISAYVTDDITGEVLTSCSSLCNKYNHSNIPSRINSSSCSGINGCCEANIPKEMTNFTLGVQTMNTKSRLWANHQCTISDVVDKDFSEYAIFDFTKCEVHFTTPIVLDWSIGNKSCHEAVNSHDYICSRNSKCRGSDRGVGYLCSCLPGYGGNPYLYNGCQDIDECKSPKNRGCPNGTICVNTPGSYYCTCPHGYHSDMADPRSIRLVCLPNRGRKTKSMFISLGIGLTIGLLMLVAFGLWLYKKMKKIEQNKVKKKLFKKNGGLLLKKQIYSRGNVSETKIFISEELEKATDNFNESRVLGKGGLGTVYKGMLSNGSIVAVKKSNKIDENQLSQFINEVLILSQINHRHIVKLLGCCLETEVPLLVYEYVPSGTLSNHLHDNPNGCPITWENRLRIAAEIAGALAYLHSYASMAIFHRDIKSSNILLDENYRAVVSDFGLSRLVSIDKTHVTTLVGGTFGYLDPEYFRSGQLNDKSDVYAFGVLLAELLTGQKAISSSGSGEGLVIQFRASIKENRLFEVVDNIVSKEGKKEEIMAVANLSKRCLKLSARKRPQMKEVVVELEQLTRVREGSISRASFQENNDNYSSTSERSYSYTVDMVTEDSQDFY